MFRPARLGYARAMSVGAFFLLLVVVVVVVVIFGALGLFRVIGGRYRNETPFDEDTPGEVRAGRVTTPYHEDTDMLPGDDAGDRLPGPEPERGGSGERPPSR